MFIIDLIPDQFYFSYHSYDTGSMSLHNCLANFDIFNLTIPEFLVKKNQVWVWLITLKNLRIDRISVLLLLEYFFNNPWFSGLFNFTPRKLLTWHMRGDNLRDLIIKKYYI